MDAAKIKEIDSQLKEQMRFLDGTRANYFGKDFFLVTNFEPYRSRVVYNELIRSPQHHLLYVRRGMTKRTVNMEEYTVHERELLLVPANFLFSIDYVSGDFTPIILSFRFDEVEARQLIGYETRLLPLNFEQAIVIENYLSLIQQIIQSPKPQGNDVEYLVVSMMYHIKSLNDLGAATPKDRTDTLRLDFMRLLAKQTSVERRVSYYSDKLNITDNHLSQTIKKSTGRTVMEWIDESTLSRIRYLLSNTDSSLDDIAEDTHLGSTTNLIRFFKRKTGITPNEYRNKKK